MLSKYSCIKAPICAIVLSLTIYCMSICIYMCMCKYKRIVCWLMKHSSSTPPYLQHALGLAMRALMAVVKDAFADEASVAIRVAPFGAAPEPVSRCRLARRAAGADKAVSG